MRREIVSITCDSCKTLAEIEDKTRMPEGWYQVRLPDADGKLSPAGERSFDLCSLRCLGRWTRQRNAVLTPKAPSENGRSSKRYTSKAPCPECGTMFSPQGFRMHFQSAHSDEDWRAGNALYRESFDALYRESLEVEAEA